MRSVYEMSVVSPNTGIPFDVRTETIEDACRDCGGDGHLKFSTIADLRACVHARRAFDADEDRDWDYYPHPEESGRKDCERCGNTGHFKGGWRGLPIYHDV